MGHARVYTISDTVSRMYKMQGYNVCLLNLVIQFKGVTPNGVGFFWASC